MCGLRVERIYPDAKAQCVCLYRLHGVSSLSLGISGGEVFTTRRIETCCAVVST